jgi:hypothetical protein
MGAKVVVRRKTALGGNSAEARAESDRGRNIEALAGAKKKTTPRSSLGARARQRSPLVGTTPSK